MKKIVDIFLGSLNVKHYHFWSKLLIIRLDTTMDLNISKIVYVFSLNQDKTLLFILSPVRVIQKKVHRVGHK